MTRNDKPVRSSWIDLTISIKVEPDLKLIEILDNFHFLGPKSFQYLFLSNRDVEPCHSHPTKSNNFRYLCIIRQMV